MGPRLALHARNALGRYRIAQLPENEIYARTYASYFTESLRHSGDLQAAGAAMLAAETQLIDNEQQFYDLVVLDKTSDHVTVRDRRGHVFTAVDLVTNSYNDLEWIPGVREQLAQFVRDAPLSSCISRKIAGLHTVHDELRTEFAAHMGYDRCVLGTNGYISQISTLFALFHEGDVIFSDQHNHSSLVDGCRLSHARVIPFPHRDYGRLEELLKAHRGSYNGAGILSDGVFSTKGSVADVDRIVALAQAHTCLSVIDDTHGIGVLGAKGRGVIDLYAHRPDVLTGGFGKAFGSFGGFALANRALASAIDILGRQNVNSSYLSPIVAAQCLYQFRHYRDHHADVAGELNHKLRTFNAALARHGIACYPRPDEHIHPIFCLYKRSESETLACHRQLIAEGFLPSFFPPPVAPFPSLRFSVHRCLKEDDLVRLADRLGGLSLFVDSGGAVGEGAATAHPRRFDVPQAVHTARRALEAARRRLS